MAMILVTHDLGVVAGRAHDIAVMYAGEIVEQASARALFANVRHPYTEALLQSIPKLEMAKHTKLDAIGGRPPDLVNLPTGCPFAPRCRYAQDRCHVEAPELLPDPADPSHLVACHFPVGTDQAVPRHDAAVDGTLDHPEVLDAVLEADPDHDDLPSAEPSADPAADAPVAPPEGAS
jgi:oligopeptide/dipeptide ABC transporter ATP-binding protein